MNNVYNWIIIILFVFIFGQCVITQKKYDVLEQNYNDLLFEKTDIIDSLKKDNLQKIESITILENEILNLNFKIDSLYRIKEKVNKKVDDFNISVDISEGSYLLKQNLNEKTTNIDF